MSFCWTILVSKRTNPLTPYTRSARFLDTTSVCSSRSFEDSRFETTPFFLFSFFFIYLSLPPHLFPPRPFFTYLSNHVPPSSSSIRFSVSQSPPCYPLERNTLYSMTLTGETIVVGHSGIVITIKTFVR